LDPNEGKLSGAGSGWLQRSRGSLRSHEPRPGGERSQAGPAEAGQFRVLRPTAVVLIQRRRRVWLGAGSFATLAPIRHWAVSAQFLQQLPQPASSSTARQGSALLELAAGFGAATRSSFFTHELLTFPPAASDQLLGLAAAEAGCASEARKGLPLQRRVAPSPAAPSARAGRQGIPQPPASASRARYGRRWRNAWRRDRRYSAPIGRKDAVIALVAQPQAVPQGLGEATAAPELWAFTAPTWLDATKAIS